MSGNTSNTGSKLRHAMSESLVEQPVTHQSDDNSSHSSSRVNSKDDSMSDFSNDTGTSGMSPGEAEVVARFAAKQVFCLKLSIVMTLVVATAIVGSAIYFATRNGEEDSFHDAFHDDAIKLFDTFKFNVERKLGSLDSLSVEITSLSSDSGATWPNFTIPDFEYHAANVLSAAEAISIMFIPLVTDETRPGWEEYVVGSSQWMSDSIVFLESIADSRRLPAADFSLGYSKEIYNTTHISEDDGPFFPIWQNFPFLASLVNLDIHSVDDFREGIEAMFDTKDAIFGKVWDLSEEDAQILGPWLDYGLRADQPVSKVFYPVFDTLNEDHLFVGLLSAIINWETFFSQILPPDDTSITAVLSNECNQTYTYDIVGEEALFAGKGDLHDPKYDYMAEHRTFEELFKSGEETIRRFTHVDLNHDFCAFSLAVYATQDLEDEHVTARATFYSVSVVLVFGLTILMFLVYDYSVNKRQQRVMKRAVQSRAIVSSLFPAAVRDRLFRGDASTHSKDSQRVEKQKGGFKLSGNKVKLKSFMAEPQPRESKPKSVQEKPIADLFPHTTVMFGDIAGFTKWSSERDPTQVFTLLQTVYNNFDKICKKRIVFKVETIGDCYVAVTGLPDPQADHAIRMAKFANECKDKFTELVGQLKATLGEDTATLAMRFGLHSGPVTAGVLRGEKSRFQLFGNTVNTAAAMEHTGERNRIQVSGETADLITEAGKGHWIFLRIDDIAARGGIQTYWVEPQSLAQEAKHNNAVPTRVVQSAGPVDSSQRLVDWNVDLLKKLLQRIIALRMDEGTPEHVGPFAGKKNTGATVRDEMVETIALPKYDKANIKTSPNTIKLDAEVQSQLGELVTAIAGTYRDNAFHNFKHASSVCTSANKMMNSIVDDDVFQRTSHPLTQFAVVFSALIHDADHRGLTNAVLMKEEPQLGTRYRHRSVAEQNSVDLAWNLLMDPKYEKLHDAIFSNNVEYRRFRQIVVNIVMATDIFDRELNGNRHERWLKAFDDDHRPADMSDEDIGNLKATVMIESSMQLADIMHTMQHFHSFQRWNERLFEEMYTAFLTGRSKTDPSHSWFEGEIWFFDHCVIPLAQSIKESKIFGAQGEDCLRNAIENKKEWAIKGTDVVKTSLENVLKKKEVEAAQAASEEKNDEQKENTEEEKREKQADRDKHLIAWNVDLFKRLLRQILAHRMAEGQETKDKLLGLASSLKEGSTVRDELARIVEFPEFDKQASKLKVDPEAVELSETIQDQLREYVSFIASMYNDHAFHNFKHASNVATSANKYLQRVKDETLQRQLVHPLTQFAVIFSSLVHDVDHPGVPNNVLVKEKNRLAVIYNNKSVAEQNSVDIAWSVLMDPMYSALQTAICGSQEELIRLRRLMVNAIMATDIFDEELAANRSERWEQAFSSEHQDSSLSDEEQQNLRATVLMEQIMISADIGHAMQHFHSFKRWNERWFFEQYQAFEDGRLDSDPSQNWYEKEIKFFDEYVFPLANRLKDCGVFGMAGDDALRCAQSNRKEWIVKGGTVVEELKQHYEQTYKQEKAKLGK